jgi:hypothetical protein
VKSGRVLVQAGALRDLAHADRLVRGAQHVKHVGAAVTEYRALFRGRELIRTHVANLYHG